MRWVALGLFCLACSCYGRREQSRAAQQELANKDGENPLKAVARLLLEFNAAAALYPCSRGVGNAAGDCVPAGVHFRPAASSRQSSVHMFFGGPEEKKIAVEALNARTEFQAKRAKQSSFLKDLLDEKKDIYLLGYGPARVEIGEKLAMDYLGRTHHDVSKVMGIAYPELEPDFQAERADLQGVVPMSELLEKVALDDLSTLGTDVMKRLKHKFSGRVISAWDGGGSDADYKIMEDGLVIYINDENEQEPPPIADPTDMMTKWTDGHKKAALTIDVNSAPKESRVAITDLNAGKVAEGLLEFMKPGIVADISLEFELEKMKISELRKKAIAMEIDEDDIDEADDSSEPRNALIDLIKKNSKVG